MDLRPGNQTTVLDREGFVVALPGCRRRPHARPRFSIAGSAAVGDDAYYELARPKRFELLITRFLGWHEIFSSEISLITTSFV
jgi:hypothetical protein